MSLQIFRLNDRNKPEIKEIQRILQKLGLYPFGIDGNFGFGTYRAVIAFQQKNKLTADGVVGPNTLEALRKVQIAPPKELYSVEAILTVCQKKGYRLRKEQYRINLIGIRKDDIFDNQFSDTLVVLWVNEKKEWEKREFKWTTMPGTLGQGVLNPITVMGVTGTAVLKEGQYLNAWTFIDSYAGWLLYPYFYQSEKVTVYRDGDRDLVLDYEMPQQTDLFGINIHRMSNNGIDSDTVNATWVSWSIGCQGAPEPTFRKLVALARVTAKLYGNLFDYTLLHKRDFENVK